jgi:hypothetical protein
VARAEIGPDGAFRGYGDVEAPGVADPGDGDGLGVTEGDGLAGGLADRLGRGVRDGLDDRIGPERPPRFAC